MSDEESGCIVLDNYYLNICKIINMINVTILKPRL